MEEIVTSAINELLVKFERNPDVALDAILRNRIEEDDPAQLLLTWIENIPDESTFIDVLDLALYEWIERHWGRKPRGYLLSEGRVWQRVFHLLYYSARLYRAGYSLEKYFDSSFFYLWCLGDSEEVDPLGWYLAAVGVYQLDRTLEAEWWQLTTLPRLVQPRHATAILAGIFGLPCMCTERNNCCVEVVRAMVRLQISLGRLAQRGQLTAEEYARLSESLVVEFDVTGDEEEIISFGGG